MERKALDMDMFRLTELQSCIGQCSGVLANTPLSEPLPNTPEYWATARLFSEAHRRITKWVLPTTSPIGMQFALIAFSAIYQPPPSLLLLAEGWKRIQVAVWKTILRTRTKSVFIGPVYRSPNMSASEAPISTPAVTAYTPQIELDFQLWIHRPEHKNRWRMSPEKARTLVLYCTHPDYKAST